jgi:hypothetical protein
MLSPRRAHHAVARSVVASGLLAIVGAGAHAEPSIATSADVAVGGGSYAGAWYAGADLRLDTQWRALQVGLGARFDAVDGNWHSLDFHQRRDALRVLRYAQWQHRWGDNSVALAAGNLAPLTLGTLAHGYRASIDVRRRVGVTARVVASSTEVEGFVDDVLQPYVAASAVSMAVRRGWRARVAAVADVDVGQGAIELSGRRVGTVEAGPGWWLNLALALAPCCSAKLRCELIACESSRAPMCGLVAVRLGQRSGPCIGSNAAMRAWAKACGSSPTVMYSAASAAVQR